MTEMCEQLRKKGQFNGLYVINAFTQSEESKREDAANDGLSEEKTRAWIEDYACINIHIDTTVDFTDHPYAKVEIDHESLENDFHEFMAPFLGGKPVTINPSLDLNGGDTEVMKLGYGA